MSRAFLILALLLPAAACASAQAKVPVEAVALDVPSVPPRVIEPVPVAPAPAPPSDTAAVAPPVAPTTKPRPTGREGPRAEPKPDAKPEVVEQDPPPPPPVAPLRMGTQSNGPEVEKQIRDSLTRNKTLIDSFDARNWSEDRKAALESAKDSIDRGWEALKAGNVVLARSLADRAETLGKLLVGR